MKIKNVKGIQAKSRKHQVQPISGTVYAVVSATSGSRYTVRVASGPSTSSGTERHCTCTCDWSKYRPGHDQRCGCSHAVAVLDFIAEQEGRTVMAWGSVADAQRQHRPAFSIGDGVVLTTRLVGV